jgi:hypothetical protein
VVIFVTIEVSRAAEHAKKDRRGKDKGLLSIGRSNKEK